MKASTKFKKEELVKKLKNQLRFHEDMGNHGMASMVSGRIEKLVMSK
jgi:hypothetical protein